MPAWRTCAVHLQGSHAVGLQAGSLQGTPNDGLLAGPIGGGQAAAAPILVDVGCPQEDC